MTGRRGRRCKQFWMTLRKRQDTVNLKRKHWITVSGRLALEKAKGLLLGRQEKQ
jgi:hypothetical protein